jgi:hypothetical protein
MDDEDATTSAARPIEFANEPERSAILNRVELAVA